MPNLLVVNNALPVKSVKELIAYAKANPGKLTFGSPGDGATAHLSMELFKTLTGTNMVHVPYKGSAGVLADVMSGPDLARDGQHSRLPAASQGRENPCARRVIVPAHRRSRPRFRPSRKRACRASKRFRGSACWRRPRRRKPIVEKLAAETRRILKLPDVSERISGLGAQPVGGTPQEYAAFIQSEINKWRKVIHDAGVKLE